MQTAIKKKNVKILSQSSSSPTVSFYYFVLFAVPKLVPLKVTLPCRLPLLNILGPESKSSTLIVIDHFFFGRCNGEACSCNAHGGTRPENPGGCQRWMLLLLGNTESRGPTNGTADQMPYG